MVDDHERRRRRMVERQLRGRVIADERVLAAMAEVPRELFVADRLRRRAYRDSALPIGERQTISQPWVVAAICEALALRGGERVLEIGTGSGYSTAILARLAGEVISVERIESLAAAATARLAALGVENAEIRVADGSLGVPDRAPFEAIAVHAAAPAPPPDLLDQLALGGWLVIPLTEGPVDMLTALSRSAAGIESTPIAACRFVPLLGEHGFEGG